MGTTAARAATVLRSGVDADALHVAALIDLAAGDAAGNLLGRAISSLEMATRLAPTSASALVDLSAAHLARAEVHGNARDLLAAVDVASRAVELAPPGSAAHFNRALALDRLGLDGEAARAWRVYLTRDSTSGWSWEARAHLSRLTVRRAPAAPTAAAPPAAFAAFAVEAPSAAWTLGWERLLRDWGAATVAGDAAGASTHLAAVHAIGAQLAREGGDSSLTHAVRAVEEAATDRPRLRQLARAHVRFANAQERSAANDPAGADSVLTLLLTEPVASAPLRLQAQFAQASARQHGAGGAEEAERLIDALLERVDRARYPAIAARALWTSGVLQLRRGRHDAGLAAVREAERLFARLGEREYEAAMTGMAGESWLAAGDHPRGLAALHRAVVGLRDHRASPWRHAVLYLLARATAAAGLTRAAEAIEEEDAATAEAVGDPVLVVESRLARARAAWAEGRHGIAGPMIDGVARTIAALPREDARARFQAELDFTRAVGPLQSRPAVAHALLDSVVAYFAARPLPTRLAPALVARAGAALALGRASAAAADLDRAVALYEHRGTEIASRAEGAALLQQARPVFDRLVMLRLHLGDTLGALAALERGRPSFAAREAAPAPPAEGSARAPAVSYAVIGDTLLAWVAAGHRTTLARTTLDRARLVEVLERVRAAMERGASVEALRPDLARLYEWLVWPVERELDLAAPGATVALVTGDELAAVPFAALYDARRSQYLVERHALRLTATLAEARQPTVRHAAAVAAPGAMLLVADPALDWRTFPTLAPLPAAVAEARTVAAAYVRPRLLAGAGADSAQVVAAMREAEILHFAGHAVFDDARPERSVLAVAPRGLTATAIAGLDLRHLRLAVLSACETVRTPERRTGGFTGLAEAFLVAGAGGVIGSLWRVDDASTARLMPEFHRAYLRTGDAAAALREAQLALLRSPEMARRSPAAWGAFRYVGR